LIIYLSNILLVDDDKDTLRIIQKYFESKGAHVNAYSEPLLALQDFIKNNNSNGNNRNNYYD
jgi:CheY-like chemotaxis protein